MTNPFHLPGDPSLPPGCTVADIDRHFGGEEETEECSYCGGQCRAGRGMCRKCAEQDYADRKRDELKDGSL